MEKYLQQIIDVLSSPSITDWLMLIVTIAYVVATIFICIFNGKSAKAARNQINQMQKQQKQNAGIQLYEKRKNILKLFSEKKYNEIFWDIPILFDDAINSKFQEIHNTYTQLSKIQDRMKTFENHLENNIFDSEPYEEFRKLEVYSTEHPNDESALEALYSFCDKYTYTEYSEAENETITYIYRELSQKGTELSILLGGQHMSVFLSMQKYIKESIENEE